MSDPTNARAKLLISSNLERNALIHACAAVRDQEERTQEDEFGNGRRPDSGFDLERSDRHIAESWALTDQLDTGGPVGVPLGIADEIVGHLGSLTTNELEEILESPGATPIGVHIESRTSLICLLGELNVAIRRELVPA